MITRELMEKLIRKYVKITIVFSVHTKCVNVTANRKEQEKENENRNRGDGSRF